MDINLLPKRAVHFKIYALLGLLVLLGLTKWIYASFYPSASNVSEAKLHLMQAKRESQRPPQTTSGITQSGDQRLSLNFQDVSVRKILQLLANFTHINMVVSERVTGNMSIRLHDLTWQEVLAAIVNLEGLKQRKSGEIVFIDKLPPNDDIPSDGVVGQNLTRQHLAKAKMILIQLNYAKASDIAGLMHDKSSSLLSPHGLVGADTRTNTLWILDLPHQIERVRTLVKQLDSPHRQVVIEARIVNMSKECAEELGVRFGMSQASLLSGTLEGVNQLQNNVAATNVPLPQRLNFDLGATPLEATPASLGIVLAHLGHNALLDLELSALESEGRAEIIASPSLMTTNQQVAVIEAGEDIPYQETSLNGATSVAFKKAVLSLKVTPQVTPQGKLLLDLLINQDSDSGRRVQGVPIILTKSIATHVLVNQGDTIILGGIYKKDKSKSVERVPGLGNLPVVGHLFQHKHIQLHHDELIIFITPSII